MSLAPETRASLILRLQDSQDSDAWTDFVEIYEPLLLALCRKFAMQDSDAVEATQEILLRLSQVVGQWKSKEQEEGSFRGWLYRVSRNVIVRFLQKKRRGELAIGSSDIYRLVNQSPDPSCEETIEFDLEFRRRVFNWACHQIQNEVQPKTWQAFWKTQIEKLSVETAAEQLSMSAGSIYIARSRVMKKLRETVQRQIDVQWKDFDETPL